MATIPELEARLETLKVQRDSAVARVSYDGRSVEYRYFASFAVAFAEGPAAGLVRLWAGEKLLADFQPPDFSEDLSDGASSMRFRRGQRHAGRHRGGELMAENRVTTVLAEVLSSGGQSHVLTTAVVAEVLSSIAEAAPPSSGGTRPCRDRNLKGPETRQGQSDACFCPEFGTIADSRTR
jgi:hypothetical protein